jgi:uncharacterized protein (UPF0212 family)
MVELKIKNLDIEPLLSFLRDSYSNIFERVWECGNTTNAVFIASELALRTFSEQTITVVVQYYLDNNECEISVIAAGGGSGLLRIDWGSQSAAEDTFVKKMMELAKTQGWDLVRKHHGRKGSGCPHCGAYYQYTEEHVQDDGTVVCQNCLKKFLLEVGVKIGSREEKLV